MNNNLKLTDENINTNSQNFTKPRKRGRPRKYQIMEKTTKIVETQKKKNPVTTREIILRLPIFDKNDSEKNTFSITEDNQNNDYDNNYNDYSDNNNNNGINSELTENINVYTYNEDNNTNNNLILNLSDDVPKNHKLNNDDSDDDNCNNDDNDYYSDEEINYKTYDEKNKMLQKIRNIRKMEKQIKQQKIIIENLNSSLTSLNDTAFMVSREIKLVPMNLKLVDIKNGKTIICEKTNVACWWDTCTFKTLPCFIPERYHNDVFYVFGCFCSFSCAKSYNASISDHKYRTSDRNSLIQRLYQLITGNTDIVPLAPEREILDKFGGHVTIEEFRSGKTLEKEYKLILPPMINLIPCIEERAKEKNQNCQNSIASEIKKMNINANNFIPVKKKILHDSKNNNIISAIGMTIK
jgi:hypothetical protein